MERKGDFELFQAEILLTMKNGCGIASAAVVPENRTLAP
mgnify:CR=1 FL=1